MPNKKTDGEYCDNRLICENRISLLEAGLVNIGDNVHEIKQILRDRDNTLRSIQNSILITFIAASLAFVGNIIIYFIKSGG